MNTSMLLLLSTFLVGGICGIGVGAALVKRDWRIPYERPRLDPYPNERLGTRSRDGSTPAVPALGIGRPDGRALRF